MREGALRGLLLALLALLLGLAWLTGHPDAAIVDRAARWPGIGPLATRFRDLYRPAPPAPTVVDPGPTLEVVTIWLPSTTPPAPDPEPRFAPDPDRAAADAEPPLGRQPEPVLPLPARPPDPARWARAEALLGGAARAETLGPYRLLLDARLPSAPLARWSDLAAALDAAFAERTGRAPLGEPAEGVVVFAEEADYREFQREEARIATLATSGHASAGLAVLWGRGRSADELEATLVHELAHFVIRRAVGPALPPWLDEGLAEDLAHTPFDAENGRFALGAARTDLERAAGRVTIRGALAGLLRVAEAETARRRTALPALVAFDWDSFVAGDAPLRYAESLWLLRWLFDGGDPLAAAALRGFLADVARGEPPEGARLLAALGAPEEVEARFAAWLAAERERRLAAAGLLDAFATR